MNYFCPSAEAQREGSAELVVKEQLEQQGLPTTVQALPPVGMSGFLSPGPGLSVSDSHPAQESLG